MAETCRTVVELLARAADAVEQRGGVLVGHGPLGETCAWRLYSWHEVRWLANHIAVGLARHGVVGGDRVALAAENSLEWILTDLAVQMLRGVLVPLHTALSSEQLSWQLQHSGSRLLVASPEVIQKLSAAVIGLQAGLRIVQLTPFGAAPSPGDTWRDLLAAGAQDEPARQAIWKTALVETSPQTLSSIVYTSGTSSEPKGVMLTQGNLAANAEAIIAGFGLSPDEVRFNSLPFSHAYARMSDLYVSLAGRTQLAIGRSRETFVADAHGTQPTLLVVVPLQLARLRQAAEGQLGKDNPSAVRELLGGSLRGFVCGGAALNGDLHDYFRAQGTPVWEGYGLTEAAPVVSLSATHAQRRNSVGRIVPGTEARIADDGELLVRGEQVMAGYWQDEAATNAALGDGWLHTGDLATLDEDGFLFLKGRKREVIALASGKKVWPSTIEAEFAQDPHIEQLLVVGEGERALGALVVLRDRSLANDAARRQALLMHIATKLKKLAPHEQIRRVWLLNEPWTTERGELTPKLTVRRSVFMNRYADCIRQMFLEDKPDDAQTID